jgi:hypothetical protein
LVSSSLSCASKNFSRMPQTFGGFGWGEPNLSARPRTLSSVRGRGSLIRHGLCSTRGGRCLGRALAMVSLGSLSLLLLLPLASALPRRLPATVLSHRLPSPVASSGARLTPLRGGSVEELEDDEDDADGGEQSGEGEEEHARGSNSAEDDDNEIDEGVGPHSGYRAAFGVRVGSEAAAAAFNIAATGGMAAFMMYTKKNLANTESTANPKALDMFIAVLLGTTLFQIPMLAALLVRSAGGPDATTMLSSAMSDATAFAKGLYQDVFTAQKGMSAKEQEARVSRQVAMLKAMRVVSVISVAYMMYVAKGRQMALRAAEEEQAGAEDAGAQVCGDVCDAARGEGGIFGDMVAAAKSYWAQGLAYVDALKQGAGADADAAAEAAAEADAAAAAAAAEAEAEAEAEAKAGETGGSDQTGVIGQAVDWARGVLVGLRGGKAGGADGTQDKFGAEARTAGIPFSLKEEKGKAGEEPPHAPELRAAAEREEVQGKEDAVSAGDGAARAKKEAPGLAEMIPEPLRPFAWGGALAYAVYSLGGQALALGDVSWARPDGMQATTKLNKVPAKRVEELAALVASAFEDAGLRRSHYMKILAASLAAVGSAQGILKIFQDGKADDSITWLSSPLARKLSGVNGHMVWMGASLLLGFTGHYDKAATWYLDRPKRLTAFGRRGMAKGVVTCLPGAGGNYTVGFVAKLANGTKIIKEHTFNTTEYEVPGGVTGEFKQLQFVQDVQEKVIRDMDWPEKSKAIGGGEEDEEDDSDDDVDGDGDYDDVSEDESLDVEEGLVKEGDSSLD